MPRPSVDVVVPFRGTPLELEQVRRRLARLRLREGDTIVIADNGGLQDPAPGPIPVLRAAERRTPGYARNRGAAQGTADWLVFIDADTEPGEDLLDRYFDPPPGPGTVLLAGGVVDEPVPANAPAATRYAYLRGTLHQDRTLGMGRWAFAQTANVACSRAAFEAVGGFRESIRAGEDADLSYRLKAAGGRLERRERAAVVHLSRRTLRALVEQAMLHGAGSAWVDRAYPGSFPPRRRPGLVWWAIRTAAKGSLSAARERDRDQLIRAWLEPLWELCFELGRSRSVELEPERADRPHRDTR